MNKRAKVLVATSVAMLLVLAGAGTAYAAHFSDLALRGSTVAGVSVAGMTRDQVAAAVQQRADAVRVTVDTGEATRSTTLAELGYTVDVPATVDAVFAANGSWSSYARALVSTRDVPAVVHADPARTAAVAASLVEQSHKAGSDAAVRLAADRKTFEAVPAVAGQTVTTESFQDVAAASARDLESGTAKVEFVETTPKITTEEATEVADRANALVARKVSVSDGEDKHSASRTLKASWVTIPSTEGALGSPAFDVAKVQKWVAKVAKSAKVDTRDGVRNVSSTGDVLSVYTQARDGKDVSNADQVATAVTAAAASGKGYAGKFTYTTTPAKWTERRVAAGAEHLAYPAAEGEKWVDVNLSKHTMTAYVGGKVVYGPVKMVNGSDKKPTVVGTFKVYLKREVQTMKGTNADGTKYETPDVPWISYFHNGFALHGAPWRSSFGYAGARGSHGCINLPVPVAKWVYGFATIGTTVTTHH